jgi:RND family efflux transporter MFP subunit
MKRKGLIFIIASLGFISAVWAIKRGTTPPPNAPPLVEPAQKPYTKSLAASGIIESVGENIAVGSPENGLIQEVYVKVQDRVKKGDPLFKLESQELESELKVAEAKEEVAKAQYNRLKDQLSRLQSIKDPRATSHEEIQSKEHENAIGAATVAQMEREKEKLISLIERMTVRSPIDGIVLQKNIRTGEYLVASNIDTPPVVIGDTTRLQIRTDIDEHNATNIEPHQEAIAYLKNRPGYPINLKFSRIEPLVVPKISLTGSSKEKVDTRVLQVIYTFDPPKDLSVYVGQQVDVFIQRGISP